MEGIYVMQERERLEAELAEARKQLEEALAREGLRHADALALDMRLRVVNHERDEALAAKERAEGERDSLSQYVERHKDREERLESEVERLEALGRQRGLERDEALALADARGRALDSMIEALQDIAQNCDYYPQHLAETALQGVEPIFSLPAPEALRQQQEREAGLVAMIEALRGALESISTGDHIDCPMATVPGEEECSECVIEQTLSLTPPQALAQQRERMERLEAVAEAARKECADRTCWSPLDDAIEALDAERGQG